MKKLDRKMLTSKEAVLAEVFFIIYILLIVLGFGINGTESPSGANLAGIVISGALTVGFGGKAFNEFDK